MAAPAWTAIILRLYIHPMADEEQSQPEELENSGEKGIVPFLTDFVGAFIATIVLMVFGVNFLIFTSLSLDGLNESFNIGGDFCSPPCLSYPSRALVEDAMTERAEGIRRNLCTRAYGEQTVKIGSLELKNQECQGCNPIVAYLLILWDSIMWLLRAIKNIIRTLFCIILKVITSLGGVAMWLLKPVFSLSGAIFKMFAGTAAKQAKLAGAQADLASAGVEGAEGLADQEKAKTAELKAEAKLTEKKASQAGGGLWKQLGGMPFFKKDKPPGDDATPEEQAAWQAKQDDKKAQKAASRAAGKAASAQGKAMAKATVQAGMDGFVQMMEKLGGCCWKDSDCTAPGETCAGGNKCRPPPKPVQRKCPSMLRRKPPDIAELDRQEREKEKQAVAMGAKSGGGRKGGRRGAVADRLYGGGQRGGDNGGGKAGAKGAAAQANQAPASAPPQQPKLDPYCKAVGVKACVYVEQAKMGYGGGSGASKKMREAELEEQAYKRVLRPQWPYSEWFKRNRQEAIEMARSGSATAGKPPAATLRKELAAQARLNFPEMTELEQKAWVDSEVDVEIGRRAAAILSGKGNVDPRDRAGAAALDTSKSAQVNNTGIFRYVGGGPAPAEVTGSTPYDDWEFFGGKWGNWLAASTSSTAIGYRKVMRMLSLFFSGEAGTKNPTSIWLRMLGALVMFSLLGGSILYAPAILWHAVLGIMSIWSLVQHLTTAPLGWGWPISDCIGLWGVLASFVISPLQAVYQTLTCVWSLTLGFVVKYPRLTKMEIFGRAWGPGLFLLAVAVIASAWNRLDIYEYVPLAITIATVIAVYAALSKWWKQT